MNKSESIGKLAAALSTAQKSVKGATKDGNNPHFRSEYATLSSIWEACRDALTANGLAVSQLADESPDGVIIETVLMHSSGEWISGRLALRPVKNDPQGIGSAITYGRRYALAAIVGVAPEEDDDGEAATGRTPQQQPAKAQPVQRQPAQAQAAPGPKSVEKQREELVADTIQTCKLLNAAGDKPQWTQDGKKGPGTLTEFINEQFEVDDGLNSLSGEYLKKLLGILSLRLDKLNGVGVAK